MPRTGTARHSDPGLDLWWAAGGRRPGLTGFRVGLEWGQGANPAHRFAQVLGKGCPPLKPFVVGSRRPRALRIAGVVALLGLIAAAVTFRNPWFRGNRGVVAPGVVYRSAQPVGDWAARVREDRLATVLNLRGGSDSDPWYRAEVEATRELGVAFYDLPMSATVRPTRRQLLSVLDLLDRCRYPLLIHCKSGSDRTGLVSALYLMSRAGQSPAAAEAAFSVYYGHVPLLGTRHLHEPLHEYAAYLAEQHLPHTAARFRAWVEHDYRAADPTGPVEPIAAGPRDRRLVRATSHRSGG